MKLAWTVVLLELVIRRPLPPLPLEHVVEHKRTLLKRAADQLIAAGLHDRHAVLPVAQGRVARGRRADEIAAQERLRWPRR